MPGSLPLTLAALLRRCATEEADAWAELGALVRRVAGRALRPFPGLTPAERQDVEAGALERLVEAIRAGEIRGTSDGEIAGYIAQVLRRRALDLLSAASRARRAGGVPPDLAAPDPDPERQAAMREAIAAVRGEMATWSPQDQLLFLLKLHGTSAGGIRTGLARVFGHAVEAGTVDTRYFRLRAKLVRALKEDEP
jgi:DNA-directed RNA polymerase specialized sigma24 family protein